MQGISPRIRAAVMGLAIGWLAACSGPGQPGGSPAPIPASAAPGSGSTRAEAVSIKGFKFQPSSLSVPAGTTVTWVNEEDSLHTVTSGTPEAPAGLFDSGEIDTGVDFSFTFDEAGTYPFFCARHDFMRGQVNVTP